MSGNTITDLRATLFDTLRALNRADDPMEIERAKAISDVAQTIINSAKVEVDHLRLTGGRGSGFIPEDSLLDGDKVPAGTHLVEQRPGLRITQHKLKG